MDSIKFSQIHVTDQEMNIWSYFQHKVKLQDYWYAEILHLLGVENIETTGEC